MRPVVFSASSVDHYLDCHLRWYFQYVALERGIESEKQRVGIQVHEYVERKLKAMHWPADEQPRDTTNRDDVKKLLRVFDNDVLPTYREPVLIEASFQLEINDIPYSGVLDAVDKHHYDPPPEIDWDSDGRDLIDAWSEPEDILVLRDTKTTGSRPAKGKYRFAMIGYWLGAADLGYEPRVAQLDYIVRTKKPYYWPEPVEIDDADIDWFIATLEGVAEGVERGDYEPTALGSWHCKACPYREICGPYQRYKEVTDG